MHLRAGLPGAGPAVTLRNVDATLSRGLAVGVQVARATALRQLVERTDFLGAAAVIPLEPKRDIRGKRVELSHLEQRRAPELGGDPIAERVGYGDLTEHRCYDGRVGIREGVRGESNLATTRKRGDPLNRKVIVVGLQGLGRGCLGFGRLKRRDCPTG